MLVLCYFYNVNKFIIDAVHLLHSLTILFNHSIPFSNNKFQKMDKNYYETLNLKRNATQP